MDKKTNDDNWVGKCLTCQHCYKRMGDNEYLYCRKRNGKCEYKPCKSKKKEVRINE